MFNPDGAAIAFAVNGDGFPWTRLAIRSNALPLLVRLFILSWLFHERASICASIHPERLYENTMINQAITSVRAIKAADITSRLNLRIRLPYVCAQLISRTLTGVRLIVPGNPILICEDNSHLVESASPILFSTG
jgi:hypothetical protein